MSLVIPAYNESDNIKAVIEESADVLSKLSARWEIIVVDDGSTDRTRQMVERMALRQNNLYLISHPFNRGYGAALRTGFSNARYDYIVLFPADNQFELSQIGDFLKYIDAADIVMGKRRYRKDSLLRNINGLIFKLAVRILFGLNFNDIDCGFKLYRRRVFDSIRLTCNGALIDTELFYKARKAGLRIKEIDVLHKPRLHGHPTGGNLGVIIYAMREIIMLWVELRVFGE